MTENMQTEVSEKKNGNAAASWVKRTLGSGQPVTLADPELEAKVQAIVRHPQLPNRIKHAMLNELLAPSQRAEYKKSNWELVGDGVLIGGAALATMAIVVAILQFAMGSGGITGSESVAPVS